MLSWLWLRPADFDILHIKKESCTTGSRNRIAEVVHKYIQCSTKHCITEGEESWEIRIPPSTSQEFTRERIKHVCTMGKYKVFCEWFFPEELLSYLRELFVEYDDADFGIHYRRITDCNHFYAPRDLTDDEIVKRHQELRSRKALEERQQREKALNSITRHGESFNCPFEACAELHCTKSCFDKGHFWWCLKHSAPSDKGHHGTQRITEVSRTRDESEQIVMTEHQRQLPTCSNAQEDLGSCKVVQLGTLGSGIPTESAHLVYLCEES